MADMTISAQITITVPDDCSSKLIDFDPVEGTWTATASDADMHVENGLQHLVAPFAIQVAAHLCGYEPGPEAIEVTVNGPQGESLKKSDGVTQGRVTIVRTI